MTEMKGCACQECACQLVGFPDLDGLCHDCKAGWHQESRDVGDDDPEGGW